MSAYTRENSWEDLRRMMIGTKIKQRASKIVGRRPVMTPKMGEGTSKMKPNQGANPSGPAIALMFETAPMKAVMGTQNIIIAQIIAI